MAEADEDPEDAGESRSALPAQFKNGLESAFSSRTASSRSVRTISTPSGRLIARGEGKACGAGSLDRECGGLPRARQADGRTRGVVLRVSLRAPRLSREAGRCSSRLRRQAS
jgi:hypothetical protein